MALSEYRNLTPSELEWADHYFETGNTAALRELQRESSRREGKTPEQTAYEHPIRYHKV